MSKIHQLNRRLLILTVIATLAAIAFIYLSIRYFLRPVRQMHHCLDQFQNNTLSLQDLIHSLTPLQLQRSELGVISGAVIKTLERTMTRI